jgi:hypothetical protein
MTNKDHLHSTLKPFATKPFQPTMCNLIVHVETSQMGIKNRLLLRGVEVLGLEAPWPPFLNTGLYLQQILAIKYTLEQDTYEGKDKRHGRKGHRIKLFPMLNAKRVFAPKKRGTYRTNKLLVFIRIGLGNQILTNKSVRYYGEQRESTHATVKIIWPKFGKQAPVVKLIAFAVRRMTKAVSILHDDPHSGV